FITALLQVHRSGWITACARHENRAIWRKKPASSTTQAAKSPAGPGFLHGVRSNTVIILLVRRYLP
ncbi:hypothetical protein, partial [Aquitalea magnusonii]|uniref:hypothetical protein n=1 Tax=Aquitalea magnusonii TaxID=332411 RepID=UPI00195D136F